MDGNRKLYREDGVQSRKRMLTGKLWYNLGPRLAQLLLEIGGRVGCEDRGWLLKSG